MLKPILNIFKVYIYLKYKSIHRRTRSRENNIFSVWCYPYSFMFICTIKMKRHTTQAKKPFRKYKLRWFQVSCSARMGAVLCIPRNRPFYIWQHKFQRPCPYFLVSTIREGNVSNLAVHRTNFIWQGQCGIMVTDMFAHIENTWHEST